ncbi:MAG: hypothetical protein HOH17_12070, partial [Halieaceae bacterium]|nr:hypothetical protein [Halieaceae bacterium]
MSRSASMRSAVVLTSVIVTATVIALLLFAARIELHQRLEAAYQGALADFAPFVVESLIWQDDEWIFQPKRQFSPSNFGASARAATPGKAQAGLWLSSDAVESVKPVLAGQPVVPFTAGSSLTALLLTGDDTILWQSPSAVGSELINSTYNTDLAVLGSSLAHERLCGIDRGVICTRQGFNAAPNQPATQLALVWQNEGAKDYLKQLQGTVLVVLLVLGAVLILLQALALSWVLRPLKKVQAGVDKVIGGDQSRIGGIYPRELNGLVASFNTLIAYEQGRQQRLRHSLERLAHVLRTPLAVLSARTFQHAVDRAAVTEQAERMMHIVESELRKLTLSEKTNGVLSEATLVKPVIERITNAYKLLPRSGAKQLPLTFQLEFKAPAAMFPGNQQDLQDLYGTLLENSIRFATTNICFSLAQSSDPHSEIELTLEDDGPGFTQEQLRLLANETTPSEVSSGGFGLGLSIARDIVSAHKGQMYFDRSPLGGARISIV